MSQTGRIYKIYNTANIDKIYIGSTKETLTRRWQCHKAHAKSGKTRKFYDYIRACNYENFRIVLLEEFKYNDKSQLREVEDRYILSLQPELNTYNAVVNLEKVKQTKKRGNARYKQTEHGKQAQKQAEARYRAKKRQERTAALLASAAEVLTTEQQTEQVTQQLEQIQV